MKVAIIGSRTFNDYEYFKSNILNLLHEITISEIISGGAKGTDNLAEQYAKENNISITIIRPDYNTNNPRYAPLLRNRIIIEKSDCVIAFWNGHSKGTKFVIEEAKKKGKKVYTVDI